MPGLQVNDGGTTISGYVTNGDLSNYVTTSQLDVLRGEISAKVSNSYTGEGFGWSIDKDGFYLHTMYFDENGDDHEGEEGWYVDKTVFACDEDGVVISGKGKIAGWTIVGNGLYGEPEWGVYKYYDNDMVKTVSCFCVIALEPTGIWYYLISDYDVTNTTIIARTNNIADFNADIM